MSRLVKTIPAATPRAVARKPYFEGLRAKLSRSGLRPTRQRLALAALIFDPGDRHVTAEMLYDEALRAGAGLSLATVYNTLRQFSQSGLLREIAVYGSRTWYDTNTGPHFHFFVEHTGELFDIPANCLSIQARKMPPEGYEAISMDLLVRLRPRSRPRPAGLRPMNKAAALAGAADGNAEASN